MTPIIIIAICLWFIFKGYAVLGTALEAPEQAAPYQLEAESWQRGEAIAAKYNADSAAALEEIKRQRGARDAEYNRRKRKAERRKKGFEVEYFIEADDEPFNPFFDKSRLN